MMRFVLMGLGCVLCACEPPPVFATADKRQNTQLARIEGRVIVSTAARGNVIVFLFDAAKPPPPQGAGRPVAFTVVPEERVFASATASPPFAAPFSFSLVGPGRYLLRGFVDANRDFVPWYSVTSEVNTGDVGGAFGSVVEVTVDEAGAPVPVLDVPVSFGDAAKVPVDRPVFEVAAASMLQLSAQAPSAIELVSRPIVAPFIAQAQPVFLARLVDQDGDGAADLGPDGRPFFWPRVSVQKVDDTSVTIAAHVDLTTLMAQLLDGSGRVKAAPTPLHSLPLIIEAAPVKGRYALTVIQETGQTWRLPNELAPGVAEPLGLTPVPSQGAVLQAP